MEPEGRLLLPCTTTMEAERERTQALAFELSQVGRLRSRSFRFMKQQAREIVPRRLSWRQTGSKKDAV